MKKIFKILRRAGLTGAERDDMRQTLVSFMAAHPVRLDSETAYGDTRSLGRWPLFFTIRRPALAMSLLAILLVITLAGGAALAAESTLPGDLLYPIKIHFNEPARAALAFDAEARVAWETRRVERRLEEMLALAAAKRLDAKTSEKIAAQFSAQADRVEARLEELNQTGATDEAIKFAVRVETSITAHRRVLERVAKERDNSKPDSKNPKNSAEQTKLDLDPVIVQLEKRAQESPSARHTERLDTGDRESNETGQKKRAAEEERATADTLQKVQQTIEQLEARAGGQTLTEARAELALAETLFKKGQADQAAGDLESAVAAYRGAREHAKEAKILARLEPKLITDKINLSIPRLR